LGSYRESASARLARYSRSLQASVRNLESLKERLPLYLPPAPSIPEQAVPNSSTTEATSALHSLTDDLRTKVARLNDALTPTAIASAWAENSARFLEIIFERFDADAEWPHLETLAIALAQG
jgi:hypothetical protein